MEKIKDIEQWSKKLLRASKHRNDSEKNTEEFLDLVDQAFDACTLEVAKVLMNTFSAEPDYGTQERVVSALDTAGDEILTQAILEELPRLAREELEWAHSLVGILVMRDRKLLREVSSQMHQDTVVVLNNLLNDKEFREDYPEAAFISI